MEVLAAAILQKNHHQPIMNDERLLRLQRIFRGVFDNPGLRISPSLSPADLPDWDSVAAVQIVLAVEQEFSVRLPTEAVANIKSAAACLRERQLLMVGTIASAVAFGGRRIAWFMDADRLLCELVEAGEGPLSLATLPR
jgi:acyl carrier protein